MKTYSPLFLALILSFSASYANAQQIPGETPNAQMSPQQLEQEQQNIGNQEAQLGQQTEQTAANEQMANAQSAQAQANVAAEISSQEANQRQLDRSGNPMAGLQEEEEAENG